ncbi:hypothetical protein NPIL_72301 [Nephila pilipes]|uniref:Uncharacterized protein n=1 Tax=Nephila pilipes TaxID=299642 RepID=A0A8X6NIM2_NEPPI|nr:hypothetical protein NPIL_72301 [Nephila pilipes]
MTGHSIKPYILEDISAPKTIFRSLIGGGNSASYIRKGGKMGWDWSVAFKWNKLVPPRKHICFYVWLEL